MRASVDLRRTVGSLAAGAGDPSFRVAPDEVWNAIRTPDGPATVRMTGGGRLVEAEAWGPGAPWAIEHAPGFVGAEDPAYHVDHPVVGPLARRHRGLRVTSTHRVVEHLVRTVLGQKVTGKESKRSYALLTRATSEPAPGPVRGLLLPPDPEVLGSMAYHRFHPFGIERRRAETLIRLSRRSRRLEEATRMPLPDAHRRIEAIDGIGPWTAAIVAGVVLGDPDAVPVGDYHIPNTVAWALAGEPRADDARMLELLEPFAGDRGRVVRLLKTSGIKAPKYGPRMPVRSFEAM